MKRRGLIASRGERFADRLVTRITEEIPSDDNPYITKRAAWYGYDSFDLLEKVGWPDVLFLLVHGDLPTPPEKRLLESLFVYLANPGPRAEATQAAIAAASGRTSHEHLIAIGAAVLGGASGGGLEVERAMRFIRRAARGEPEAKADQCMGSITVDSAGERRDERVAPGFGRVFGGIDPMAGAYLRMAAGWSEAASSGAVVWVERFNRRLAMHGYGVLRAGVAATILVELGFHPRWGAVLYQYASLPGVLAHAMETATKPITSVPMVSEDRYEFAEDGR